MIVIESKKESVGVTDSFRIHKQIHYTILFYLKQQISSKSVWQLVHHYNLNKTNLLSILNNHRSDLNPSTVAWMPHFGVFFSRIA